jgi:hypothetical protein
MLSSRRVSGTSPRDAWLSLTPEPERELPASVAVLRARGSATAEAVESEHARVERLVVRARSRAWLTYMHEVVDLIDETAENRDQEVKRARGVALEVVRNHHGLLLGLPGRAADTTVDERQGLDAAAGRQTANGGQS